LQKTEEDYKSQQFLESLDYTILRFPEQMVIYRMDDVVAEIDYAIQCLEQQIED